MHRRILLLSHTILALLPLCHCVRQLPETLIVGYASGCGKVQKAIEDGVNVVIWAFWAVDNDSSIAQISSNLNMTCISELRESKDHIVHLASTGGWNGRHLNPNFDEIDIYRSWKKWGGSLFDGIDWDLEGNDEIESPLNFFSTTILKQMGKISQFAKEDGFIVSMAPPQSYLDFRTTRFSRCVNLTYPTRIWHSDFSYYGANVYAYVLAKYGSFIDFVSVQLYESYSRANYEVSQLGTEPEVYLANFVANHMARNESFFVHFSSDPDVDLSSQLVYLPLSKLVIGFANGWARRDRVVFFFPIDIKQSLSMLDQRNLPPPRGYMFWTVDLEGENGFYFAEGLHWATSREHTDEVL